MHGSLEVKFLSVSLAIKLLVGLLAMQKKYVDCLPLA